MEELGGKVAVITGAASGIGLGIARALARRGVRLVLSDVEEQALETARTGLAEDGAEVIAVPADVSRPEAVRALADRAHEAFERVHILCNNAGVAAGVGAVWEATDNDWSWVFGVNLMGVIHGLQAFVPRMLDHGEEGHIVNTSSILGLMTGGGSPYGVSKHAVTRLTEGLYIDLASRKSKLGVSVLCPGLIATRIASSWRNRPKALANATDPETLQEFAQMRAEAAKRFMDAGMPPDQVGDIVVDAIRKKTFYVLTHPEQMRSVESRFRSILSGAPPYVRPVPGAGRARAESGGAEQADVSTDDRCEGDAS
jgi:NAD(P)-dependent dehydrogenase (short-subunit alcohol dehydrogenase family)